VTGTASKFVVGEEGRFASLLVSGTRTRGRSGGRLQELWRKAMKALREIQVDPRGHRT
jgi:hypothetical protein